MFQEIFQVYQEYLLQQKLSLLSAIHKYPELTALFGSLAGGDVPRNS